MKTTLRKIMEAKPAIALLLAAKLPIKAAYAVSKLANAGTSELNAYDALRTKRFEEAGCVVEDGNYVHPDGAERVQAVVKEIDTLLDDEVEINALPLDLAQFGDNDVPGAAFLGLDWAMKE